jgi:hypothetical protein
LSRALSAISKGVRAIAGVVQITKNTKGKANGGIALNASSYKEAKLPTILNN